MRVAYLAGATIPSRDAQSIQVMKMCDAMARAGHQVTLIVRAAPHHGMNVFEFYGVEPNFRIRRVALCPVKGGLVVWGIMAALTARKTAPDVVYGRQIHSCFFAALLGLRVVVESHGPINGAVKSWLFAWLTRMPNFKRLVTNSVGSREILRERFHLPQSVLLAAPNGADDPGVVQPRDLESNGQLKVGYTGHLYRGRGIETIFEVARRCPWADFHIIGGNERDLNYWRSIADSTNNVVLHGFVKPSDVEAYRQACDVLFAPYQREVLGRTSRDQVTYMSPLKLFEYMASGRAILCADLPVLREIVTDQQSAIMCNPDDVDAYVKSLERLRDDEVLRRTLGENAREVFLKEFTRIGRARKVLDGIEHLPTPPLPQ